MREKLRSLEASKGRACSMAVQTDTHFPSLIEDSSLDLQDREDSKTAKMNTIIEVVGLPTHEIEHLLGANGETSITFQNEAN